jgi:adenylosuccinate lyase
MGLTTDFSATYANQWFERTLDDSAIRRMDIPQAFLLTDAILILYMNISSDMVVFPKQIERHLLQELPFMATEKILMAGVKKGKSRQSLHEVIKVHSLAAGKVVKEEGKNNDLLQRLAADEEIPFSLSELEDMISNFNEFTGRAKEQTEEYLAEVVFPRLKPYANVLGKVDAELSV